MIDGFEGVLLKGTRLVTQARNVPGLAAARTRSFVASVVKVEPPTGALRRLCLGPEKLRQAYQRLRVFAIVGYPAPRVDEPGHDLTYLAQGGLLSPPEMPRTLLANLAGAERAVSATLALLLDHERGRDAGYVEVAISEVAAPLRSRGASAPPGQGSIWGAVSPAIARTRLKTPVLPLPPWNRTSGRSCSGNWASQTGAKKTWRRCSARRRSNGRSGLRSATCPWPRYATRPPNSRP